RQRTLFETIAMLEQFERALVPVWRQRSQGVFVPEEEGDRLRPQPELGICRQDQPFAVPFGDRCDVVGENRVTELPERGGQCGLAGRWRADEDQGAVADAHSAAVQTCDPSQTQREGENGSEQVGGSIFERR